MFIDRVKVQVAAGNGGSGCTSFRREWREPMGGPDGGAEALTGRILGAQAADEDLMTIQVVDFGNDGRRRAEDVLQRVLMEQAPDAQQCAHSSGLIFA